MIYPAWSTAKKLNTWIADEKHEVDSQGVYVLCTNKKPLSRAMGVDPRGILYIGSSKNIKRRIGSIISNNHSVTWYLRNNIDLARHYISDEIPDNSDTIREYVGELNIIITKSFDNYIELEGSALLSYVQLYGETPPLNSALPRKWKGKPDKAELEWFKEKFA